MKFNPTNEQKTLIEAAKTGTNIVVHAGAGAAKTTSCVLIAEALKKSSLYLAFNKSIALEAEEKFPQYVDCKTIHSLAWCAIVKGTPFAKKGKVVGYWDKREIEEIIKNKEISGEVIEFLKGYCQSSFESIDFFGDEYYKDLLYNTGKQVLVINSAEKVWNEITKEKGKFKINHDVYLKLYQLSKPNLAKYKVIYLDEFQDTNPVSLDIFLEQEKNGCQLIAVGDKAQSIYAWRGAINAFSFISGENWKHLTLSESFRFNEGIASLANIILSQLETDMRIIGRGKKEIIETKATLVRNNSTLFSILLGAADLKQKVEVIADLSELWSQMWTAFYMMCSEKEKIPNYGQYPNDYIKSFGRWKDLQESTLPEIKKIVNLISGCRNVTWEVEDRNSRIPKQLSGVPAAIAKAKSAVWDKEKDNNPPDFVLVTGHKSKGLEWDEISLTDDFLPTRRKVKNEDNEWVEEDYEEMIDRFYDEQGFQLLYVAITRARVIVKASDKLQEFVHEL